MLVMMTVDRFQAICYPLTNQGNFTQVFTRFQTLKAGTPTDFAIRLRLEVVQNGALDLTADCNVLK